MNPDDKIEIIGCHAEGEVGDVIVSGVSARLAVLHARGRIRNDQRLVARSIVDSIFVGRIESETVVGETSAIIPSIEGRAWTTGRKELWCDPDDPWPEGYRIADTWPSM